MSFEVMCVKKVTGVLTVGEIYTVLSVVPCRYGTGKVGYELAETVPPGFPEYDAFDVRLFAPLNGPDERIRLAEWQDKQAVEYDRQFAEILEGIPDAI